MALQSLANKNGVLFSPFFNTQQSMANSVGTINAAGESVAIIGEIFLEAGSGSKTISSSGGKIHWRCQTVTFSNAGTTLRIGIQDVAATGLEDTTYDVYAELVGGTDTITGSAMQSTAMETGSKTISNGDRVAVILELTARGGTDSIQVSCITPTVQGLPYGTADTGSGPVKSGTSNAVPLVTVEFDDGTVGWFHPYYVVPGTNLNGTAVTNVNTGSTPDERALVFRLPFKAAISSVFCHLSANASTDDFEMILYSDPLGTPVAERTFTVDGDYTGGVSTGTILQFIGRLSSDYTLNANTDYAVAIRPTTANSIDMYQYQFGATNLLKPTVLGTNWYLGTRSNQTGAFSTTTTTIPIIGFWLSQFDDGASAGGVGIIGG